MASNFPGFYGSANNNLGQPFSNYSNGSTAFYPRGDNQLQGAQGHGSKAIQSHNQPQHQFNSFGGQDRPQHQFDNFGGQTMVGGLRKVDVNLNDTKPSSTPQQPTHSMFHVNHVTVPLPAGWETEAFWTKEATTTLPGGQVAKTTVAHLYERFPSLHAEILQRLHLWRRDQERARQEQLERLNSQNPSADTNDRMKSIPHHRKATKAAPTPRKKTRALAVPPPPFQAPPYTPDADLDTPQKCRDYLAYIDPANVHALTFPEDDKEDVLQNRKHHFIGQIFEALAHPYSQTLPTGITLSDDAAKKYHSQQQTQLAKVYGLLQTTSQIKAAKALCSILFDAAVYVHEVGVPKEMYDKHQWYVEKERQIDRKFRLDLESICSARLEKIIDGIKANKLIAMDVLEKTNFERMARDPGFYLLEKFTYLRSNKTRQEKIDVNNKQTEEYGEMTGMMVGAVNQQGLAGRMHRRQAIEESLAEEEYEASNDGQDIFNGDDLINFDPTLNYVALKACSRTDVRSPLQGCSGSAGRNIETDREEYSREHGTTNIDASQRYLSSISCRAESARH